MSRADSTKIDSTRNNNLYARILVGEAVLASKAEIGISRPD